MGPPTAPTHLTSARPGRMGKAVYSAEQIHQFYGRIDLPERYRYEPGDESRAISQGERGLELLSALQRFSLAHIPFENLSLHYSRTKTIDLHPTLLFRKIVSDGKGRGGYCMENNTLFATVLRSLGFKIMCTGGRVNSMSAPNGDIGSPDEGSSMYYGFAHMVNIVTIQGRRYAVDVGYGAGSATRPLPLEDGVEHVNIRPGQMVRLRFDSIEAFESNSKVWIFERKVQPHGRWAPMYCFPDGVEFLPADYLGMNMFTSSSRMVFFTYSLIVVKFVQSEDGEEVIGEKVCLDGKVHRRVPGKKEWELQCHSEHERADILEQEFNIHLDDEDQSEILGMVTML